MKFLWPEMLWVLLIVPALVGGYFWLLRRSRGATLRYASLSMVKEALGTGPSFRRHIPPLLLLVALIVMMIAAARPAAVVTLPSQHQTIILAMDISGSMRAVDVEPPLASHAVLHDHHVRPARGGGAAQERRRVGVGGPFRGVADPDPVPRRHVP